MKTSEIIRRLNACMDEENYTVDWPEYRNVISSLWEAAANEEIKKAGNPPAERAAATAAKKLLNRNDQHSGLRYATVMHDGKQAMTDTKTLVILRRRLPLPAAPDDYPVRDISEIVKTIGEAERPYFDRTEPTPAFFAVRAVGIAAKNPTKKSMASPSYEPAPVEINNAQYDARRIAEAMKILRVVPGTVYMKGAESERSLLEIIATDNSRAIVWPIAR